MCIHITHMPANQVQLSGFCMTNGNIHLLPILNSIGLSVTESNFRINTASGSALLEYVRQGLGMSILTQDAQDICPELERVLPELPVIPVPIWIVTHRELRTSRRIRIVFDVLAEEIREQMGT
ncbi:MAG: LysR substrate-binding domain-containing protein [Granulosicoccus sp.]